VVGSLNTATDFLFSILAGNGINSGIILQSRYMEERTAGKTPSEAALAAASATWRPTLFASLAAACAYGALGATSFRVFRQFGFIGSAGMILCCLATYASLPPLMVLLEKLWPIHQPFWRRKRIAKVPVATVTHFEWPFLAILSSRARARAIAVGGMILAVAGLVATAAYLEGDPLEYNLRHLENDRSQTKELYRLSSLALSIVGARTEGSMIVLADRLDQVPALVKALRDRRDAAPPAEKPFQEVHSLLDLVPAGQEEKLVFLQQIRRRLEKFHTQGFVSDEEWKNAEPLLPPPDLKPFTVDELPLSVRRPFTEKDGTVGRIVYVEPKAGQSDVNLHYLLRWAAAFRATTLPGGEVIHGSGRAVIYADLVAAVISNGPVALMLSLLLTGGLLSVTLGRRRQGWLVLAALSIGLAWLGGLLWLGQVRIHFVNFIALPITFGIAADYALNVMARYQDAGSGGRGITHALRGAAGPVILCSLTTTLGYLALLKSRNQAVCSLGLIAVFGEVTCLLAAVLILPAWLVWRQGWDADPLAITDLGSAMPPRLDQGQG
jgi:predicted RND superfamily exporter protein